MDQIEQKVVSPPPSGVAGELEKANEQPGLSPGGFPEAIPYEVLERKHPEYDAPYWRVCKALYSGGKTLLRDKAIMKDAFPQHKFEADEIYRERCSRAFYIDYPGEIIDFIVAGLMASPLEMKTEEEGGEPDEFYEDFEKDLSPASGKRQSLSQLLRQQILTALQCKRAWTQVDFPTAGEVVDALETEAEQEDLGLLSAYALALDPECVYDWEVDGTDELTWAITCVQTARRGDVLGGRNMVTKTYTVYTRERWARYRISFPRDKEPNPKTLVVMIEEGEHTFTRVPLLRLELPDGLWAMNKLYSLAIEYFNKRCALAWAEYKSLFQERYEFEAANDPMAGGVPIANDPNRALNQIHGIGYTQLRYAGDKVEYIGPSADPFDVALKSLKDLRDEMHRVVHQMALTFDNSPSALRRSGESKAQDKASHTVVLTGLAEFVRDHAIDIFTTVSIGRGDELIWTASGMNKFDNYSVRDIIEDAEKLELISIPSQTFQVLHKHAVAKYKLEDLGCEATEEDLKTIREELEENLSPEVLGGPPGMGGGSTTPPDGPGEDEGGAEGDEDDEGGEDKPPARRRPSSGLSYAEPRAR